MTSRTWAYGSVVVATLFWSGCSSDDGAPTSTQTPAVVAGSRALIEGCVKDEDCESKVCFPGDQGSYCSLKCTPENATTVCVAPMGGTCNKKGFCKKP
ncbi:MAG: hypothetical protein KF819_37810 [Labilithrix sp.]|nr:hypothetical protein [Labilithrix sp.]